MLVLVVTKKMRDELRALSELALRAGFVIAGAQARLLLESTVARLNAPRDRKQRVGLYMYMHRRRISSRSYIDKLCIRARL